MINELMEKMRLNAKCNKEESYEIILHESMSAVQNYIRTGKRSKLLQWIIECEDKFQENYKQLLDNTLKSNNIEIEANKIADFEKIIQKCVHDEEMSS